MMRWIERCAAVLMVLALSWAVYGCPPAPEPAELGLRLAYLEMALGTSVNLPELYALDDQGIRAVHRQSPEQILDELSQGRRLVRDWIEVTPEDLTWRELLNVLLEDMARAEDTAEGLPEGTLEKASQEALQALIAPLNALRRGLKALTDDLEGSLATSEDRWSFSVGYLSGPLLDAPSFAPALPEEERQFLAEAVPHDTPPEVREAVALLLELLPDSTAPAALMWRRTRAQEAADAARTVLAGLGIIEPEGED